MPNQEISAVAISASAGPTSKSRLLLEAAADRFEREAVGTSWIDLRLLPADGLLGRVPSPAVVDAIALVAAADIVIAASPVYRASYSGLLKVFFDLLPVSALAGKVCIAIATAAAPGHQLVLEHAFQPLFASLGGLSLPNSIFAVDAQFGPNGPDAHVIIRVERAVVDAIALARSPQNITPFADLRS